TPAQLTVVGSEGRGLGNPHGVGGMKGYVTRAPLRKLTGAAKVPHGTSCSLLTRHHAQAATVLNHSRALPQGDGSTRPAFARGAVRCECNLVVLDARDVLHNAFAVRGPRIDAEREVSSKRRGHLRLLLPDLLRTSRNSLGPLRSRRLRRCRSSSVTDGSLR